MLLVLAGLGLALVGLGVLVLLRFPDRPGGDLRLLGLEVSSIGAGLPLIALGVLVVVLAVAQQGDRGQPAAGDPAGGGTAGLAAGPPPKNTPACIADFFAGRPDVARGRQRTLAAEAEDVLVLGQAEPKSEEFGLVLTEQRKVIGAAKMSYDVDAQQFRFDALVDARCRESHWISPDVPGPNPSIVSNYTTPRLMLGDGEYDLELKAEDFVEMELHRFEH